MLVVECAGCESVHFCKLSSNSEDVDEVIDKGGISKVVFREKTEQFPEPDLAIFKKPQNFSSIAGSVRLAYEETYQALQNDMPKLAAAGARLVVESVCLAHKIKDGTLKQKIDRLKKEGHITQSMKIMLHNVRLFGNQHLHTTRSPDFFDLSAAWDAVNNLLIAIYGIKDSNKTFDFSSEIKNKPQI
jgi:hypothetical protein